MNTPSTRRSILHLSTLALAAPLFFSGCGVDAVGAAATGAAVKQQELKQAKETRKQVDEQLEQINTQNQKRMEQLEENR